MMDAARELRRVINALSEVIQKDAIGPWLEQPNEAFGGLKPIEVIERGEVDRIWQMFYYLRSGVPAYRQRSEFRSQRTEVGGQRAGIH